MTDPILQISERYRTKGVLVDTNILVLDLVGSFNVELIPRFRATKTFQKDDYTILRRFLGRFEVTATTPNILSEASNLLRQGGLPVPDKNRHRYFENLVQRIRILDEHYVRSRDAVAINSFPRIGLTDAAILLLAKGRFLVLTDDLPLSGMLERAGIDALNFNHIRYEVWQR